MTRGNQRELARAKNQKKQQEIAKKKAADGLSLEARKHRDAEIMREKLKKKQDAAEKETKPKQ